MLRYAPYFKDIVNPIGICGGAGSILLKSSFFLICPLNKKKEKKFFDMERNTVATDLARESSDASKLTDEAPSVGTSLNSNIKIRRYKKDVLLAKQVGDSVEKEGKLYVAMANDQRLLTFNEVLSFKDCADLSSLCDCRADSLLQYILLSRLGFTEMYFVQGVSYPGKFIELHYALWLDLEEGPHLLDIRNGIFEQIMDAHKSEKGVFFIEAPGTRKNSFRFAFRLRKDLSADDVYSSFAAEYRSKTYVRKRKQVLSEWLKALVAFVKTLPDEEFSAYLEVICAFTGELNDSTKAVSMQKFLEAALAVDVPYFSKSNTAEDHARAKTSGGFRRLLGEAQVREVHRPISSK